MNPEHLEPTSDMPRPPSKVPLPIIEPRKKPPKRDPEVSTIVLPYTSKVIHEENMFFADAGDDVRND